jgi:molecular chaperone GrpE
MGDNPIDTPEPGSAPSAQEPTPAGIQAEAANEDAAAAQTLPMEEQLRQAEIKSAEHYDAWLRAKAETDNVRRRTELEAANARKFAVESFSGDLLPVKDALEAALATENVTIESLHSGVELTLKQLKAVFERFKISEVNPIGEKFDPHKHQAIATVESDAAPNSVVTVLQKGYLLHERVLRPALVTVAKTKAAATENGPASS